MEVERTNKTIKESIFRYMSENNTQNYVSALSSLVYAYNTTVHSTLGRGLTPMIVHRGRDSKADSLFALVRANEEKKAEQMIRRNQAEQEELEVGDFVRIDSQARKNIRRLTQLMGNRRRILTFSKEIYKIVEKKYDDRENDKYRCELFMDADGKEQKDDDEERWYFRFQLKRVDMERLNFQHHRLDREELDYGARFNMEAHLDRLHRARREEVVDEKKLERQEAKAERAEIKEVVTEMKDEEKKAERAVRPHRTVQPRDFGPVVTTVYGRGRGK